MKNEGMKNCKPLGWDVVVETWHRKMMGAGHHLSASQWHVVVCSDTCFFFGEFWHVWGSEIFKLFPTYWETFSWLLDWLARWQSVLGVWLAAWGHIVSCVRSPIRHCHLSAVRHNHWLNMTRGGKKKIMMRDAKELRWNSEYKNDEMARNLHRFLGKYSSEFGI